MFCTSPRTPINSSRIFAKRPPLLIHLHSAPRNCQLSHGPSPPWRRPQNHDYQMTSSRGMDVKVVIPLSQETLGDRQRILALSSCEWLCCARSVTQVSMIQGCSWSQLVPLYLFRCRCHQRACAHIPRSSVFDRCFRCFSKSKTALLDGRYALRQTPNAITYLIIPASKHWRAMRHNLRKSML